MTEKLHFYSLFQQVRSASYSIGHSQAHWINNKQDLNVRKYIDGLEPKPSVNFITIFEFQNRVVRHLPGPVS